MKYVVPSLLALQKSVKPTRKKAWTEMKPVEVLQFSPWMRNEFLGGVVVVV